MTNEELISELVRHKEEVQNDFGWNTTLQKALDAAIAALKAEPCEDAISRQAVLEITAETGALETQARVKALPPVVPKQKTGHWIVEKLEFNIKVRCSCCNCLVNYFWSDWNNANYCPNCGEPMEGVSE